MNVPMKMEDVIIRVVTHLEALNAAVDQDIL